MELWKKKILLCLICIIVCSTCMLGWFSNRLMPVVMSYGDYECENMIINITNKIVEQMNEIIKEESIVDFNEDRTTLNYNVEALNSINVMAISKLQYYLKKIERGEFNDLNLEEGIFDKSSFLEKGIIYAIPVSKVFDNSLISNLLGNIFLRYKIISQISGEIVSEISEYGINNALVEIKLKINARVQTIAPTMNSQKKMEVYAPLSMLLLQGEIPDSFYGSQIIGGENK